MHSPVFIPINLFKHSKHLDHTKHCIIYIRIILIPVMTLMTYRGKKNVGSSPQDLQDQCDKGYHDDDDDDLGDFLQRANNDESSQMDVGDPSKLPTKISS